MIGSLFRRTLQPAAERSAEASDSSNVYLGSAELAAICARLGKIPSKEEYMADIGVINANGDKIYRYMNFDKIADYKQVADTVAA